MLTADTSTLWRLPWIVKGPLLAGTALLLLAMALFAARLQFLATAEHRTGIVSALKREAMQDNGEGYRMSVTFRDAGRNMVTVDSSVVSSATSWRVGDAVGVDYPANQPQDAVIATFVDRWLPALVIGGIATVALLIGGIGLWMVGRPDKRVQRVGNAVVGMSWERDLTGQSPAADGTKADPPQ
jgi:hypothetical protein